MAFIGGASVEKIGTVKEIDRLGRLQIPKEIRKRLGFGKSVELIITSDGLLIKSEEYRLIKKKMAQNDTPEF